MRPVTVESDDFTDFVQRAELSERQREVVMVLHCFEWTSGEVADVLGLSKGTVHIHDRRGLARLRREMGVE